MRLRRKDAVAGLGRLDGMWHLVGDNDDDECVKIETSWEGGMDNISQGKWESSRRMGGASYEES
jgi:hypothetical protein